MAKNKFYVVWQGVEPGVYDSWEKCKAQVEGFVGARYKSFGNKNDAEHAFNDNPWKYIGKSKDKTIIIRSDAKDKFIKNSIAVDAACSGNPGPMEYRGVFVDDGTEIFRVGPMANGTNNVGEFLAIVHALALLKNDDKEMPIYSDSMNAIKWVFKKKCNTKLKQTEANKQIFNLIERAEKWLNENKYSNPIIKWETDNWGEIPADFGRK